MMRFDDDPGCLEAAKLLESWDDILVICHASPDGDALGSMSGLVRGLRALGKRADWYCADPVPDKFLYLFEGLEEQGFEPGHVMTVDVADQKLLGDAWDKFGERIELAIDHHRTHKPFASTRWVGPEYAATCEMVWRLLDMLGCTPLKAHPGKEDVKVAQCIYTGIATDTGCFKYANVTAATHMIAASCLEVGVDCAAVNQKLFDTKTRAQIEAERRVLETMEFFADGKAAIVQVPLSLLEETGAKDEDVGDVVNLPRQVEEVLIGVAVKEKEPGKMKVSLRTNPPVNAAEICGKFGGGGHAGAAGCSFEGLSMTEASCQIMAACEEYLKEMGSI